MQTQTDGNMLNMCWTCFSSWFQVSTSLVLLTWSSSSPVSQWLDVTATFGYQANKSNSYNWIIIVLISLLLRLQAEPLLTGPLGESDLLHRIVKMFFCPSHSTFLSTPHLPLSVIIIKQVPLTHRGTCFSSRALGMGACVKRKAVNPDTWCQQWVDEDMTWLWACFGSCSADYLSSWHVKGYFVTFGCSLWYCSWISIQNPSKVIHHRILSRCSLAEPSYRTVW